MLESGLTLSHDLLSHQTEEGGLEFQRRQRADDQGICGLNHGLNLCRKRLYTVELDERRGVNKVPRHDD